MKHTFAFLMIVVASAAAAAVTNREDTKVSGPGFTRVYSEFNNAGYFYDFTDYVPDLRTYNFDNIIRSACQTGIWFYYDQTDYNQVASAVYWMHGIEYCGDFPLEFADVTSSLRYGGSPYSLNEDSFTLYQGELFTGSEFWSNTNSATLDYLDLDGSSLLLTGVSAWTFFTGTQYTGVAVCVYPSTDHDVGQDGTYLDLGIFASMADLGIPDNSIRSAVRGCYSEKVVRGKPLDAVHRAANGAMGVIRKNN